jgi:hypothetical protein
MIPSEMELRDPLLSGGEECETAVQSEPIPLSWLTLDCHLCVLTYLSPRDLSCYSTLSKLHLQDQNLVDFTNNFFEDRVRTQFTRYLELSSRVKRRFWLGQHLPASNFFSPCSASYADIVDIKRSEPGEAADGHYSLLLRQPKGDGYWLQLSTHDELGEEEEGEDIGDTVLDMEVDRKRILRFRALYIQAVKNSLNPQIVQSFDVFKNNATNISGRDLFCGKAWIKALATLVLVVLLPVIATMRNEGVSKFEKERPNVNPVCSEQSTAASCSALCSLNRDRCNYFEFVGTLSRCTLYTNHELVVQVGELERRFKRPLKWNDISSVSTPAEADDTTQSF